MMNEWLLRLSDERCDEIAYQPRAYAALQIEVKSTERGRVSSFGHFDSDSIGIATYGFEPNVLFFQVRIRKFHQMAERRAVAGATSKDVHLAT